MQSARRLGYVALTAAFLFLLLITLFTWIRSQRTADLITLPLPHTPGNLSALYFSAGKGGFVFGAIEGPRPDFQWKSFPAHAYGNGGWSLAADQFGFDAGATYVNALTIHAMVVPAWFVLIPLLAGIYGSIKEVAIPSTENGAGASEAARMNVRSECRFLGIQ